MCGTCYLQRFRLLAHLRRYRCGRELAERAADFQHLRLSEAEAARLDDADNVLYRAARFRGGSTPTACGAARRADGTATGSACR